MDVLYFIYLWLGVLAALEWVAPRRRRRQPRGRRWLSNLALTPIGWLAIGVLAPFTEIGLAFLMQREGFGLFHWVGAPAWLSLPVMPAVMPPTSALSPSAQAAPVSAPPVPVPGSWRPRLGSRERIRRQPLACSVGAAAP